MEQEVPLTSVNFHVCLEVSALGESSPTYEAFERSFSRVNHKVALQCIVPREHSTTGLTLVDLLRSAKLLRRFYLFSLVSEAGVLTGGFWTGT